MLFGACILAGHEIVGGSDHGLLPNPEPLQVVITVSIGTLLGILGGRARQRRDGSART